MSEKVSFDIMEIRKHLPHRYPFLLIDKMVDIEPHVKGTGIKCVSGNEPFFQGHFPHQPIMPGVLILEAMAQTAIMVELPFDENGSEKIALYAGVNNAKFKRPVGPGDILKIEAELVVRKRNILKIKATATVDGELACSADLMAAIVDKADA